MLKSGIIYNDHEFSAGRVWIYCKTNTRGKADYKRRLTDDGKVALKRIADETDERTLERHRAMQKVWDLMTEPEEV